MKILIIEDDENKIKSLKIFLEAYYEAINCKFQLEEKNSFQSGLKAILTSQYDLLILDMSLPNFDKNENNDSGQPLSKGGELILFEMDVSGIETKTVLVTQHDDFDGESLESISKDYRMNFPNFYVGHVFYNAIESSWKKEFKKILDECQK